MDPSLHHISRARDSAEEHRLQVLDSYGPFDRQPAESFARITKLATLRLRAKAAFIAFVGRQRIALVARHGLNLDLLARHSDQPPSMLSTRPFWATDLASGDPGDLAELAALTGFRFFAAAPLTTYNGHVLGMLCVADSGPRPRDPELARELEELAGTLMKKIETRRLYHRLERNQGVFERRRHHRGRVNQPATPRQPSLDRLTAIPDRHTLLRRLGRQLEHLRHRPTHLRRPGALLVLDLDDFHHLNAEHGYAAGDQVLAEITRRLESLRGPRDTVCRLSGDSFALLLGDLRTRDQLPSKIDALHQNLAEPINLGGRQLSPSLCLGVSWLDPGKQRSADDVLAAAEAALLKARNQGAGSSSLADEGPARAIHPAPKPKRPGSRRPSEALRTLANEELSLRYRPLADDSGSRPGGFEAQLRWHPGRSPGDLSSTDLGRSGSISIPS